LLLWGDVLGRPDESFGAVKPLGAVQEDGHLLPFDVAVKLISCRRTATRTSSPVLSPVLSHSTPCATPSDLFFLSARSVGLQEHSSRIWVDACTFRRVKGDIRKLDKTMKELIARDINDVCLLSAFAWIVGSVPGGHGDETVAAIIQQLMPIAE
jgi:hypothetical protein